VVDWGRWGVENKHGDDDDDVVVNKWRMLIDSKHCGMFYKTTDISSDNNVELVGNCNCGYSEWLQIWSHDDMMISIFIQHLIHKC
jgi:hypothetical protein